MIYNDNLKLLKIRIFVTLDWIRINAILYVFCDFVLAIGSAILLNISFAAYFALFFNYLFSKIYSLAPKTLTVRLEAIDDHVIAAKLLTALLQFCYYECCCASQFR